METLQNSLCPLEMVLLGETLPLLLQKDQFKWKTKSAKMLAIKITMNQNNNFKRKTHQIILPQEKKLFLKQIIILIRKTTIEQELISQEIKLIVTLEFQLQTLQ